MQIVLKLEIYLPKKPGKEWQRYLLRIGTIQLFFSIELG